MRILVFKNCILRKDVLDVYKRQAEWKIVERDIAIAKETNARMHVQHISSKEAVELVRKAKAEGLAITAEATPHHFTPVSYTHLDVYKRQVYGNIGKLF